MRIVDDDLSSPAVVELLQEHLDEMRAHSPPESTHALDLEGLRAPGVTFWTARDGDDLLGCAALKQLDERHGEIKSMRTAKAHLGRGVGSALLGHLLEESRRRGYARLSLETGSGPLFEPALALYAKFGFEPCGPFASYRHDPFSRFMTIEL